VLVADLVLDGARPFGQIHPVFGQRLAVTHPDEFPHTGFRPGVLAAHGELGDALVEQRADLRGDDQPAPADPVALFADHRLVSPAYSIGTTAAPALGTGRKLRHH
jgi:hypothetical protein